MSLSRVTVVALMMLVASSSVSAQVQDHASFVPDVVKNVILDPTTYAPAIVAWTATHLDWPSSQIFLQNGSVEHHARFTVNGRGDDTTIGYASGNRQIVADAIANLQLSLVDNVSARVVQRLLMPRYPHHRTLLRTIGEKCDGVVWSYRQSAGHFRQWRANQQRVHQLGYD